MKNNKGLSTVVTTLIIILLVLVAVGIIWGVVNNLLGKSSGTIESSTKCLDLEIRAVKVNQTADGVYDITLKRSSAGDDEDIYAKIVLYNAADNTEIIDFGEGLQPLETAKQSFDTANYGGTLSNATKIEVTAYYLDENGKEKLCPATTEFEF